MEKVTSQKFPVLDHILVKNCCILGLFCRTNAVSVKISGVRCSYVNIDV